MVETKRRRSDRPRSDVSDSPRGGVPGVEPGTNQMGSDEVARRAYEFYEHRGGEHGHDRDDWFQAEREVRQGTSHAR
jgi:hypothetical protein